MKPSDEDDGFSNVKIADKSLDLEFALIRIKYAYESDLASFKARNEDTDEPSEEEEEEEENSEGEKNDKKKAKRQQMTSSKKTFSVSSLIEKILYQRILGGRELSGISAAAAAASAAAQALEEAFFPAIASDVSSSSNSKSMTSSVTTRRLRIFVEGLRSLAEYSEKAYGDITAATKYYNTLFDTILITHAAACEGAFTRAAKALCAAFERAVPRYYHVLCAAGDAHKAITMLRHCLFPPISAVTSHPFRLKAIRMLIDTDLYHCDSATWVPFDETFPLRPKKSSGEKEGVRKRRGIEPRTPMEEAAMLLVLLDKETMGVGLTSYDDMYFVLGAFGQSLALGTEIERDVSLHSADAELWKKLAYALVSAGKPENALCICDKCLFSAPKDLDVLYLAASLALDHLSDPVKAMTYAQRGINAITELDPSLPTFASPIKKQTNNSNTQSNNNEKEEEKEDKSIKMKNSGKPVGGIPLSLRLSKFYVCLGISAGKLGLTAKLGSERLGHQKTALKALHLAVACDPADFLACHYLALQYADIHEVDIALFFEQRALALNPGFADSWNATALLFSAKKLNATALTAADAGLRHCPGDVALCMTKAALEIAAGDSAKALETCLGATEAHAAHIEVKRAEDAVRITPPTASSTVTAGSSSSSSSSSSSVAVGAGTTVAGGGHGEEELPIEVCLTLSKAFLSLRKWDEARCLLENQLRVSVCRGDSKATAKVLYAQGTALLQQQQQQSQDPTAAAAEAMLMFDKALSVDPTHLESLIGVATIGHSSCNEVVEEMHILSALSLYPFSHSGWYAMGSLLQKKGMQAEATECLVVAARLEDTSPVIPFTTLPRKASIY